MHRFAFMVLALCVTSVAFAAERPLRFWNLTRHTISEFYLAAAGTTNWGANQCKNDKDGTVDSDERLRITDTRPASMTRSSPMSAGASASFAISSSKRAKYSRSRRRT